MITDTALPVSNAQWEPRKNGATLVSEDGRTLGAVEEALLGDGSTVWCWFAPDGTLGTAHSEEAARQNVGKGLSL